MPYKFSSIVSILLSLLFLTTPAFSEIAPKSLIIIIPGATEGLDPSKLWLQEFESLPEAQKPFIHETHIYNPTGKEIGFEKTQGINYFGTDTTVFKIFIHYSGDLRCIAPEKEIALDSYSPEAKAFIDSAVVNTLEIIRYFIKKHPTGYVDVVSAGMSGEVLMKCLKESPGLINSAAFWYPTMAMVNDARLVNALKEAAFTGHEPQIVVYEGDPTIPKLEEQKGQNPKLFRLVKIKLDNP